MNTKPTPHDYRRDAVTFWIGLPALILIIAFIVMACSCTVTRRKSKDPCKERRGISGFGYGFTRSIPDGKILILAPDGAIVYSYYEPIKCI